LPRPRIPCRLARTGGFDGCVECEEIRLLGDLVHGGDDLADLLRSFGKRQDALGQRPVDEV
jgi:hypothetical protein